MNQLREHFFVARKVPVSPVPAKRMKQSASSPILIEVSSSSAPLNSMMMSQSPSSSSSDVSPRPADDGKQHIRRPSQESTSCLKKKSETEDENEPPSSSLPKSVSFAKIEISEYPYELGDNPSTTAGPPLTIGWTPQAKDTFDLDEYEQYRPMTRCKSELQIPHHVRTELLQGQGVTMRQILSAQNETRRIRKQREKSIKYRKWDPLVAAMESASRSLQKVGRRRSADMLVIPHEYGADDDVVDDPALEENDPDQPLSF